MDAGFSATAGTLDALPTGVVHHILAVLVGVQPSHSHICKRFLASVRYHYANVPPAIEGKVTRSEMAHLKASVFRLDLSGDIQCNPYISPAL